MRKLEIKEPLELRQSRDYPEHVGRILRVLESHGYTASKSQARRLWLLCSAKVGASWLTMPSSNDAVWEHIAEYINGEQNEE
jgi:hypothetical protein